ncbi:MAG: amidohydrolase family protein [Holophagaceae bacterium]
MNKNYLKTFFTLLVTTLLVASDEPITVIRGARIYPLDGPVIENGMMIIQGTRIKAIGTGLAIPEKARIIEAKGFEIVPGFINVGSQTGISEIGSVSATQDVNELGSFSPHIYTATAIHAGSEHFAVTRADGITMGGALPGLTWSTRAFGSGGPVISGHAAITQFSGWTGEQLVYRKAAGLVINWPEATTSTFDFATMSRKNRPYSEVKAEVDKKINAIQDWIDQGLHYASLKANNLVTTNNRDLKLEGLIDVVEGREPVLIFASSPSEIKGAVEFSLKNKLKMILMGGYEAEKVKDLLKKHNIPVVLGPTWSLPPNEDAPYDYSMKMPSNLYNSGIKCAIATFSDEFARRIGQHAGTASAYGLPKEEALKMITKNPAEIFGLSDVGTLTPGKAANFVIFEGDSLETRTKINAVYIQGQEMSLENKQNRLYEKYLNRIK